MPPAKQELVDAFRARDPDGHLHTVEVWARVTYSDGEPSRRSAQAYAYYLRDGTRLIRRDDRTFMNMATGEVLTMAES